MLTELSNENQTKIQRKKKQLKRIEVSKDKLFAI